MLTIQQYGIQWKVIQNGIYNINRLIEIGGFYVSRFWVVEENGTFVSRKGVNFEDWRLHKNRTQLVSGLRNNFINTSYAKTSLISGAAYDSMMKFLSGKWTGKGIFNENAVRSSDGFITGGSANGSVCNIFDIAPEGYGCLTAELLNTSYMDGLVIFRGGPGIYNDNITLCPSCRTCSSSNRDIGSPCTRATLYVF